MEFKNKLDSASRQNNSLLCVGLDSNLEQLPVKAGKLSDPFYKFNQAIIDATADLVSAYKANSAFYEAAGADGIRQLKMTIDYLHDRYPTIPMILDAKRADIGNTNDGYVKFVFDYLGADAVTLHPYLGKEALEPFLVQKDKGMIILCRTSNPGADEFQDLIFDGKPLYQHVAERVAGAWNTNQNCMLVVGATYPEEMKIIREIVGPEITFLVPGIGAQGGDLRKTMQAGINDKGGGLIIHSARGIIFASSGDDFPEAARQKASELRDEINKYRSSR